MPRKGMRSIFFSSHTTPSSSVSSPLRPPPPPLYSYSNSMLKETMRNAEDIINRWNRDTSSFAKVTSLFYESKTEAREFVKCVRDLQRAMYFLISQDPSSETLIRAHNLMQIAMKRLEKEFYQILSINRDQLDSESISGRSSLTSRSSVSSDYEGSIGSSVDEIEIAGNSITQVENQAAIAMSDLKLIADCMISCGYGMECVKMYQTIRKSIVNEGLYRLGIEPISSKQIQKMDWQVVELKIKNWLSAVKIAVTALFYGERLLCDNVFSSSKVRDSCFSEISRQAATLLFQFPEQVIKSKKSPEKIFRLLTLYSATYNLCPEIDSTFSFESNSDIRSQVMSSLVKLGKAVGELLTEFESTIKKDSSRSPVQGGGVHHLTQWAMNYVSLLADYSIVLPDIVTNWPLPLPTPLPEFYCDPRDSESAISRRFACLILILLSKLDQKAKLYKDVALSYLFLANNLQFVVSRVCTSNLQSILGNEWISMHEMKFKLYAANYEQVGWQKVVSTLLENQTEGEISLEEARTCLKRFNSAFETVYRTQSSWIIPDSRLRCEIQVSVCNKLLPAYRLFYERYTAPLKEDKDLQNLVKFLPHELESYLSDVFYSGVSLTSS